jgi:predicted permease
MAALSLQVTAKDFRGPHSVIVTPLREEIAGKTQTALILLLSASAALLLIACVNLTNLLLSRGAVRGREVAVRTALGAGRGRLIAQVLTESLVLAAFGTLAGLALALPAMRFLERLVPEAMGAVRLTLDWRVLAFSAAAAIAAALTFGLAPALRGSRVAPQEGLRDGGRGTAGARSHWFQHALIIVETALAVVLLTCGGLLLQTFQHLRNTDVGFRSERLLTFETPLFRYKDFNRRVVFINAELEAVRVIPGVINAGAINRLPFTNVADATFYWLEGQSRDNIPQQVALMRNVSRDYFATVGASPHEGRFFSAADQASKLPLAIINEPFANRHFRGRSPLGQRFKFGATGEKGYWYTIVGVVKPIREAGVLEEMKPAVYRLHEHCDQVGGLDIGIVVRTAVEPASIVSAVRQAIWSLDKNQPLARIQTMEEIVGRQLSTPSQSTALLGACHRNQLRRYAGAPGDRRSAISRSESRYQDERFAVAAPAVARDRTDCALRGPAGRRRSLRPHAPESAVGRSWLRIGWCSAGGSRCAPHGTASGGPQRGSPDSRRPVREYLDPHAPERSDLE